VSPILGPSKESAEVMAAGEGGKGRRARGLSKQPMG
jgi:hypothetical protein